MRLFDKVLSQGNSDDLKGTLEVMIANKAFAVLDADQSARYVAESGSVDLEDFPYAVCPWRYCFVEWHCPRKLAPAVVPPNSERRPKQCGAFITSLTASQVLHVPEKCKEKDIRAIGYTPHGSSPDDVVSGVNIWPWIGGDSLAPSPLDIAIILGMDGGGAVSCLFATGDLTRQFDENAETDSVWEFLLSWISIPCTAFTFANCKNVSTVDVTQGLEPPPKIKRRLKIPEVKRYTLKIGNDYTPPAYRYDEQQSEGIMPHHLCRGHFATYTEAKPLFGKYVGKFWIPPHMKGKKENGEIVKDYAIDPATVEAEKDNS